MLVPSTWLNQVRQLRRFLQALYKATLELIELESEKNQKLEVVKGEAGVVQILKNKKLDGMHVNLEVA